MQHWSPLEHSSEFNDVANESYVVKIQEGFWVVVVVSTTLTTHLSIFGLKVSDWFFLDIIDSAQSLEIKCLIKWINPIINGKSLE